MGGDGVGGGGGGLASATPSLNECKFLTNIFLPTKGVFED